MTPPRHLDLVSHWRIAAPLAPVWAALADPAHWPLWWPAVQRVQTLQAGADGGVGGRQRLAWSAGGPFSGVIELETLDALPPAWLRARAGRQRAVAGRSALQGECIWLLRAEGGSGSARDFNPITQLAPVGPVTQVTHVWRLALGAGPARWGLLALAPLLRALHGRVMRAGALGLARHLAGEQRP